MIDSTSRVPLHVQLERVLREKVHSLNPGDRLPTEKELKEQFNVSGSTVRQALQSLVNEGLVYRKVAKGTFVAPRHIREELSELLGFSQMARSMGFEPGGKLIEAGFVSAPDEVAAQILLPPGTEVSKIVRVRYANSQPVCVETTYLRKHIGALLLGEDLEAAAYYPLLEEKYHIILVAARETIGAAAATAREAELLGIPKHSPVLTVERVTYTSEEVPSEIAYHAYRADLYRYGAWRRRTVDSSIIRLDEPKSAYGSGGY